MLEMRLKQPWIKHSAFRPFTKNKARIQKFEETGNSRYIYQIGLCKAGFRNNMAYWNFKYWTRRTASDKISHDRSFKIVEKSKYDGYQHKRASLVFMCK